MGFYSDNHNVEDTCLSVINDGNGEMSGGYDYRARCDAARRGDVFAFRFMARSYGRYRKVYFESPNLSRAESLEAGDKLLEYYRKHVSEVDGG